MRTVSDAERRARLGVRHGLAVRATDVAAATAAVTCLHATEPASVYLSAYARTGCTRADVDAAIYTDRSIVRQLAMRRTVFAFPADRIPAVLGSASARVATQQATRLAKDVVLHGLGRNGERWVREQSAAVLEVLSAGPATTSELRKAVPALEGRLELSPGKSYGTNTPIAGRLLTALAATGAVIRGENAGDWRQSRPRWTLAEQWLPGRPEPLESAAGYAVLVADWLRSFGPGTEADIVWWLGATKAAVRQALSDVGAEPVELADGSPAWLHPDDTAVVDEPDPWAALLPSLDPTTMGWKGRDFYLGEHAEHIFDANGNGGPTAWWNGRIVGGWVQDAEGRVEVVPVAALPRGSRQLFNRAAAELTDHLAGDVVRSIYESPLIRRRADAGD